MCCDFEGKRKLVDGMFLLSFPEQNKQFHSEKLKLTVECLQTVTHI